MKSPFIMVFDDACPSHRDFVIPALVDRELAGTFYIVPAAPWYDIPYWSSIAHTPGIVLANHTFTHAGSSSVAQAEEDVARAETFLDELEGGRRPSGTKRSFCIPGGVPWTLSPENTRALLDKYDLIHRPRTANYRADTMTPEELLATPDRATSAATRTNDLDPTHSPATAGFPPVINLPGYLVFHGVGGDWLSTNRDLFLRLLDKLVVLKDKLWVTDPISWHQQTGSL